MIVRLARRSAFALLFLAFGPMTSLAHVGSPDVIFDGKAGPYVVRIIVRVPSVVPGLADVSVRILEGDAREVRIRPVYWRAGVSGSPSPDLAKAVRGTSNLYSGQLWLMARGAYSVYVTVSGPAGAGTANVPVMSVATGRLGMSAGLRALLAALGILLIAGLATIAYVAAGESVVEPGRALDRAGRRRARIVGVVALPVLALALMGGARWWRSVDTTYQSRMYRAWPVQASLARDAGRPVVRLTVVDGAGAPFPLEPLVPDHGKMMHLFLIDSAAMATFAHLHPTLSGSNEFWTDLPPLPPGSYRLYGDITTETGQTHTLAASLSLTPQDSIQAAAAKSREDPDDSWHVGAGAARHGSVAVIDTLDDRSTMEWLADSSTLRAGADATLRFVVHDPSGAIAVLEPYLGMSAHAVVARGDGSVFVHLHPAGTISMAAQAVFALRDRGDTTRSGRLRVPADSASMHAMTSSGEFSLPYVFPRPGVYRIWVQVKRHGRVLTGVFDVTV